MRKHREVLTLSSVPPAACSTIERRTLYLGDIVHVVLDEADRMLDIGFRPDIENSPQASQPAADSQPVVGHDQRRRPKLALRTCTSRSRSTCPRTRSRSKRSSITCRYRPRKAYLLLGCCSSVTGPAVHRLHLRLGARRPARRSPLSYRVISGVSAIHGELPPINLRPRDAGISQRADLGAGGH